MSQQGSPVPESVQKSLTLAVGCPRPGTWKRVLEYVGLAAIVIVVLIVIIAVVSIAIVADYVSKLAEGVKAVATPLVCWHWLEARQNSYLGQTDPRTGQPYTSCEAARAATSDAKSGNPAGPCPTGSSQIYPLYVSTQC